MSRFFCHALNDLVNGFMLMCRVARCKNAGALMLLYEPENIFSTGSRCR